MRHSQYTTAASRTATRIPIMTSLSLDGSLRPAARAQALSSPAPEALIATGGRLGGLIARLGQQRVALRHRRGDVDHRAVAAAGVVAQAVERPPLVDAVALHDDALGALDQRAALERGLEALNVLDELALLRVAAHGHLDGGLDRLRFPEARVAEDPALGGGADERGVLVLEDGDDRPARELADLLDELERVAVLLVDDDDRQVRVVARDDRRRGLRADRHLGDLM